MERENQFKGVNSIKFHNAFSSDDACYEYIAPIKWSDGYVCRRCDYQKFHKGKQPYSRRCMKCKYDESPTSGTMFDKCKFSLRVAFHIGFKISTKKKGMSTMELSEEFELRQKTCWAFKWKVQQVMQSSYNYPLTSKVHIDEFYIRGEEEGKRGRSKGKKKLVIVALEIVDNGVGRAYARVIPDASANSFKPFFQDHIDKDAIVTTDEWNGYKPLKIEWKNIEQMKSDNGKNFPDIHLHIMNMKSWLRGIHHHCSEQRLQGYLDEFHFRYNRRNNMDTIFDLLIKRMVRNEPIRLNMGG